MWQFRSNQTYRDLRILKSLFIDEQSLTVTEFAELLECDKKTAYIDLLSINERYNIPNIYVDLKTDLVNVKKDYPFYPTQIYQEFFNNNLEFKVLEYIFVKKNITTYDLTRYFSISESTLYRLIHHLNGNLANYDIVIDPSSYLISGDEINITRFFSQFFIEKNTVNYFGSFTNFQKAALNIYYDMINSVDAVELKPYFRHFQWYFFVSLIRSSSKNRIPVKKSEYDSQRIKLFQTFVDDDNRRIIESIFGLSLKDEEIVNDIFYMYINNLEIEKIKKYRYDVDDVTQLSRKIYNAFNMKSSLTLERFDSLLYRKLNYFYIPNSFLFDQPNYELKKIETIYPKSIKLLDEIFSNFFKEQNKNVEPSIYAELVLFVVNIVPNILQIMSKKEEKVIVNYFLITNSKKDNCVLNILETNFGHKAYFVDQSQTISIEQELLDDGVWITDVPSRASKRTFVINPNFIHLQLEDISLFIDNNK